jgi:CRISPR/Cas system-associated endoribonuclease Cas2
VVYLISYDLNRPRGGDDYPDLIAALKRDGAVRILYSEWLVESVQRAEAVANRYLAHMDGNDSIFVCEVTTNSAYKRLMNETTVVTKFFPRLRRAA